MATPLANIKVGITLVAKAFNRNLKKTTKNVKRFRKDLGFLKKAAIGLAGAFAIRASARGLLSIFDERRGIIDKVGKFADELGFSTEKLAELQFAAKLTGTNVQILNKGLQIFTRRIGEARQGTGEARKGMERLGLTADQLADMATDDAFKLVAERIDALGTQSEKAGISFMFFSRQGQDLLNLFQLGQKGFKEIENLIESFGGALSRFETKKVEEMNDSFERLQLVIDVAKDRFIATLSPAIDFATKKLQDFLRPIVFIDKAVDHLRVTIDKFRKPLSITLNFVKIAGQQLMFLGRMIVVVTSSLISMASKFASLFPTRFKESFEDMAEFFGRIAGSQGEKAVKNLQTIIETFSNLSDSKFLEGLEGTLDAFDLKASQKPDSLVNTLADIEDQAKATIKALNFQQVVRQFKALNDQSTDLSFLNKNLKTMKDVAGSSPAVEAAVGAMSDTTPTKRARGRLGHKAGFSLMGPIAPPDQNFNLRNQLAIAKGRADRDKLGLLGSRPMATPAEKAFAGRSVANDQAVEWLKRIFGLLEDPLTKLDSDIFLTNVPGRVGVR